MVQSVSNPELKKLAFNLDEILKKARADNTLGKYETYFNKWSKWCSQFEEVSPFPGESRHFVLFLLSLIQSSETYAVIESTWYAVKHFHNIASQPDPTRSQLADYVLDAAKRLCCRPKRKKQPITPEHIRMIHNFINKDGLTLLHQRNFTMILLCFSGFLRYEEVANLTLGDIVFCDSYMKLFIEKAKTDQFREGAWVFIAKVDSLFCPLRTLKSYIDSACLSSESEFLFRGMTYFKSLKQHRLKKRNTPLSYSTARTTVLSYLHKIGLNEKLFGLHSLRRGGATTAANKGVNDRLFQKHGRWKSVSAKDGYVDDDLQSILSVTLGLGL